MTNNESHFHALANTTLSHIFNALEDAFERGALEELELNDGILTIETSSGKIFVLSKHTPSQQLWLASPLSGGHHFLYDSDAQTWHLPDGQCLATLLSSELEQLMGEKVTF